MRRRQFWWGEVEYDHAKEKCSDIEKSKIQNEDNHNKYNILVQYDFN